MRLRPNFQQFRLSSSTVLCCFQNIVIFSSMSHERTSLTSVDVKQGRSALKNENAL